MKKLRKKLLQEPSPQISGTESTLTVEHNDIDNETEKLNEVADRKSVV